MSPQTALVRAIVATLKADAAVAAAVPEAASVPAKPARVFDEPPADDRAADSGRGVMNRLPYVYIGAMTSRPSEPFQDCGRSWDATVRIFAATFDHGRETCWDIAHACVGALHWAQPALEGGYRLSGPLNVPRQGDVVDRLSPNLVFLDVTATITTS